MNNQKFFTGSPTPRGANNARGADMLAGANQILSASNRRSPFLLLHKLSIQKQHLQKQKARAERHSDAIVSRAALIETQMTQLAASLGFSGPEASSPSPAQFRVPSSEIGELETRNPKPKTHLKEVRYRY